MPSGSKRKAGTLGAMHSPLTKLVLDALRERILGGEFAAGERLAEERLSMELGVSRMPVREALRVLASEGIVTIEPRRGASVTTYSDEQVLELIEVRATLEALNAKLAARRHDPKQIAELERILATGTKLNEKSELSQIQAENARFHEAIAAIAANSVLTTMVRMLRDRTALIFAPRSRNRARQNWQEHAGIVRAVIAGDAELAALLAARHVYSAAQLPDESASTPALAARAKSAASPRKKATAKA